MVSIRKARLGDLKALQEISMNTFYEAFAQSNSESDMQKYLTANFSADKLKAELTESDSHFYIAWDGDSAIGYLKLNTSQAQTDLKEEHSLEIERIYVMKAYQGKKVGQFLYEQAAAVADHLGKTSVWLGVWENNFKAIRFYERNGFVAFGTHEFKMGDDIQNDILMRKSFNRD